MKKRRDNIAIGNLQSNTGQIDWLPRNPRQWTKEDLERTMASLVEDPDYLEDRPLLVVPNGNRFIVFAGNLRLSASRKCGFMSLPCVVYEAENDEDCQTIRRRAMKDNGSFGAWDVDALANHWDDQKEHFEDWGITGLWTGEDEKAADGNKQDEGPLTMKAATRIVFRSEKDRQRFYNDHKLELELEYSCVMKDAKIEKRDI